LSAAIASAQETPDGPYDVGQAVELTCTFTDADSGELVTPSSVTCEVISPTATAAVALTPTSSSPGVYTATVTVTADPGQWYCHWTASDPGGATERMFLVNPTAFASTPVPLTAP
jgi:hypothetical protein